MPRCIDCRRELDEAAASAAFREVVGFVVGRTQGGANTIAQKRMTGRLLCLGCMTNRKKGISPGQGKLT